MSELNNGLYPIAKENIEIFQQGGGSIMFLFVLERPHCSTVESIKK